MSSIQNLSITASQSLASASPQSQQSLQPFANLDLTQAQRTSLRSIFTNAKQNGTSQAQVQQQVDAVLSPAQQKTLQSDLSAFRAEHHHHGQADAAPADSAASTGSASGTTPTAASSTTALSLIANVQNQIAAATSTLNNTLAKQLLAAGTTTTTDTSNEDKTAG
jgi:hypothetical protein